jgi:hypothetical protein
MTGDKPTPSRPGENALMEQSELDAAHCWEAEDAVPGRPAMTDFRRRLRFHQARWRETNGHPIGTQPIAPKVGKPVRLVGSRLPLDYALDTGANFVTAGALEAARARTGTKEPHQTLDHQRLWADLLWSPSLAFNLFGDLAADLTVADRAVHALWPDTPGTVSDIRFAHSPGRLDPSYLNSLRAFDAAFVLDLEKGMHGIVAVNVKYHERSKGEIPRPENLRRYVQVAERSRAFTRDAVDSMKGKSDLAVMWLEHLLLHSMLQHDSRAWSWGRYIVVHPAGNSDVVDQCNRYGTLLKNTSTFASVTLENVLVTDVVPAADALRNRYLPS